MSFALQPHFLSSGALSAICYVTIILFAVYIIRRRKSLREEKSLGWVASTKRSNGGQDYSDVFPPSQRPVLAYLDSRFPYADKSVDTSKLSRMVLRMEENYATANYERFIYSGFSVGDVLKLGDFLNYAALSEVPLPKPAEDFDIKTAQPRPYRPLRWPYHQTMSFQKMETDYWIELDNTYHRYIQERKSIYAKNGKDILNALPGSELACKELMEMVIQFLCARYPRYFQLDGNTLTNRILGTEYELSTIEPLHLLLENVPEDFAIMLRDPQTGRYHFRAGVICASTGWSLGTKLGLGLPEIHEPVPDYREKMQLSMDRFFTKMPVSKPIQRGAWGFEVGQHLYMPPEDPGLDVRNSQDQSLRLEDLFFRVDWQTLRRLPLSGAIVFNFKAFFTPVTSLKDEPYIPSLSLKIVSDSKENLIRYKSVWHVEHILKPALAEYERYQLENGIMEKDWQHQTLPESPFFRGWEAKWKQ
ncbi:hypothetical protein N0V84_009502 [Fusarium piperis]|uniref:Uncharacterized protein n=1 Tax=Fusarium piperis TaxID=1435070 RepID=A0A9W9BIK4_9HYPO|nr:hypothetical protein N0V84_009502 [Fusarium piperis]